MLKKIYQELVTIRKELQAINKSLEPKTYSYLSRMSITPMKLSNTERDKLNQFIDDIIHQ